MCWIVWTQASVSPFVAGLPRCLPASLPPCQPNVAGIRLAGSNGSMTTCVLGLADQQQHIAAHVPAAGSAPVRVALPIARHDHDAQLSLGFPAHSFAATIIQLRAS